VPFEPKPSEGLIASSRRPAEEIRSLLSSYRSGLSTGRAEAPAADLEGASTPAGITDSNEQPITEQ
jgi:hypothetical protein